jgi:periplasmic mercuric ion binding protein
MKKILIICVICCSSMYAHTQKKDAAIQTVTIQTSAQCSDCEERIESLLNYTKGVKFAELDNETKIVTVKFMSKKITLKTICEKLNEIGYDANEFKAPKATVLKLPKCCQPGGMEK